MKRFLGIDHHFIATDPIFINQESYARRMLEEFDFANCNLVKTSFISTHLYTNEQKKNKKQIMNSIVASLAS